MNVSLGTKSPDTTAVGVGGLAVTAHPFAPGPGSTWGFDPTYAAMDLVEIWDFNAEMKPYAPR